MPAPISPYNAQVPPRPFNQLVPVPIASPGQLGLNLQQQNALLPPLWAIQAENCIIDQQGRLSARGGLTAVTVTPASGKIRSIFEHRTATGTSTSIVAYDGGISSSVTAPNGSSLVGTISSVASGRWYFQNFNGKCIGFQAGQKPIVRTSGNFSNIVESGGTAPTGGVGCAAYGRVWGMNGDGVTLQYCALLDETLWTGGDSGSINLSKVWPKGMDTVKSIQGFNGTIAIFGARQILFYGSTDPSVIGLDVTQLLLVDAIEGTGSIGQWTHADVGETDHIFCSSIGIQSLQRLLVQKSRPTTQLSKNVRDTIIMQLTSEVTDNVTGYYSPTNGLYALSLPVAGITWVADQRHRFQDQDGDEVSRITRWLVAPTAMAEFFNRTNYMSNVLGTVATYGIGNDYGSNFSCTMQLPWLDLGDDISSRLKALKRIGSILFVRSQVNVTFQWYLDFNLTPYGAATIQTAANAGAQWGIAQWAIDQWSGGLLLSLFNINSVGGDCQYFSISITTLCDSNFAWQSANILTKLMRLA